MFKIAFFDTKPYVRKGFLRSPAEGLELTFFEHRLTPDTVRSAAGYDAVCVFVNDVVNAEVVRGLREMNIGLVALRCAGYNNVDLTACEQHGVSVVHVPAYSPHSVAEHALALMLALNRKITRAHARVREGNFSLDGLVGFEMHGKTAGIIGTGRIGRITGEILLGIGCRVLAYDPRPDPEFAARPGASYTELDTLLRESDILSLHVPLLPGTRHLINTANIAKMKPGVMLINTSRGALIDTVALVEGLKTGRIGSAGLDVYEEESEYFFEDHSDEVITDDVLARLLSFNNVLVTSHQAFLTAEALDAIAETTMANIQDYVSGKRGAELTCGVCAKCG